MGCGASKQAEDTPQPPIPLRTIPEASRSAPSRGGEHAQPASGRIQHERPSSSARPSRSSHGHPSRPSSSKPYSSRQRPTGSSHGERNKRPVTAPGPSAPGSRRRSSRPGTSYGAAERPSSSYPPPFNAIPENVQYAEDSTIIRTAAHLNTFIEQSCLSFYDLVSNINLGGYPPPMPELEHPATRLAGLRQFIGRRIIDRIIMVRDQSSPETIAAVSASIDAELLPYAIPVANGEREGNLHELCQLGSELRTFMSSNPSHWRFGPWDTAPGYVIEFPPLFRNGEQVASGQSFKV